MSGGPDIDGLQEHIKDVVAAEIKLIDEEKNLGPSDYDSISQAIAKVVLECLEATKRSKLEDDDYAFIRRRIAWMILELENPEDLESCPRRFQKGERVVCQIGSGRWAPGTVQAVNDEDANDPFVKHPYIVKIDRPVDAVVSVQRDDSHTVCAEVCFGSRQSALKFTQMCLPKQQAGKPQVLRFGVGEQVACAVEDDTGNYSVWAAGTVLAVNHVVTEWAEGAPVPYQVKLNTGSTVLVHRDEHWLVRDLALQPEGLRQGDDGARCLNRFTKRRRSDGGWEDVDHQTRKVRAISAPDSDSDEEEHTCNEPHCTRKDC